MHVSGQEAKKLPWKAYIPVTENKSTINLHIMNMIIAGEMKKKKEEAKYEKYWKGGVWRRLVVLTHGGQNLSEKLTLQQRLRGGELTNHTNLRQKKRQSS